jgi:hypothetical protein
VRLATNPFIIRQQSFCVLPAQLREAPLLAVQWQTISDIPVRTIRFVAASNTSRENK